MLAWMERRRGGSSGSLAQANAWVGQQSFRVGRRAGYARAVDDAVWLLYKPDCYGSARTGGIGYIAFITPGVMLLSALTAAMAGAGLLLDRLSGALKSYLIAPIPRVSILLGLFAGAVTKATLQGLLVLLLGLLLGA